MRRVLLTLIALGLGISAWPQKANPAGDTPLSVCPAAPVPVDTVWNHQVPGGPYPLNGGLDGFALVEGDMLANGGRQIFADSVYTGTFSLYRSDGTQAPGFPMNLNSQCAYGLSCIAGSGSEAAIPLDDTGQYACGVRYLRDSQSGNPTRNYRFVRPDTTFFPWNFDIFPITNPTSVISEVQEVTGLRVVSGKWGVFGTSRRSFSDTYPITPAMRMVDSQGNDYPGWPQYGVPGYTIRGTSSVENALVFPAGGPLSIQPSLRAMNYGFFISGSGQLLPGSPIPFPYQSPQPDTSVYATNIAARVNGVNYFVFEGYKEYGVTTSNGGAILSAIHLFSDSGIEQPGWPVRPYYIDAVTNLYVGGYADGLSFGDLDGDGVPELVALAPNLQSSGTFGLFAWHLDGTPVAGFPVAICGIQSHGQPVIGDIDGDGKPEIVFSAYVFKSGYANPAMLFAYHNDGTVVKQFPMDYSGYGDPGSISTPILDDFNGDGKVDIITAPDRVSGGLYVTTLNAPYNRDNIEWPMKQFDVMRTGWYRKMQQPDRAASWLTMSAAAIPGDGVSTTWITAHGIRPNTQPILLPDQFVRFGRLPDLNGGEFSTFQDNGGGSWSQKLTAPSVEDPVTVTVSGWINEFKLNQTIPVTFWGKPRITGITPRAFSTGSFMDSTLTGANLGVGVTLSPQSADLTIANALRTSETGMTARFSVPAGALPGYRYFTANAYARNSSPQWVLAYDPNDLFLLLDKTAGTTIYWYGKVSANYFLFRDTTPTFATAIIQYSGPAKSTPDPANGSFFYQIVGL